jgi:hypothetical protein
MVTSSTSQEGEQSYVSISFVTCDLWCGNLPSNSIIFCKLVIWCVYLGEFSIVMFDLL